MRRETGDQVRVYSSQVLILWFFFIFFFVVFCCYCDFRAQASCLMDDRRRLVDFVESFVRRRYYLQTNKPTNQANARARTHLDFFKLSMCVCVCAYKLLWQVNTCTHTLTWALTTPWFSSFFFYLFLYVCIWPRNQYVKQHKAYLNRFKTT